MDRLAFWKQKIIQSFHDPPAKPYLLVRGTGGHSALAQRLFKKFTGTDFKYYARRPDWAAAGADRPVVNRPRGQKGQYSIPFNKDGNNVINHPLAGGYRLRITTQTAEPLTPKEIEELSARQEEALQRIAATTEKSATGAFVTDSAKEEPDESGLDHWTDADELEEGFWRLWRRFRDEILVNGSERLFWERMPADSRVPDHSIWEHLKVTSALAFLDKRSGKMPDEKEPWLFAFTLNPVQSFIEESRTSRDLWISSFLIADLAWYAMKPIVEQYGPDAIVYPDLRANPRVDNWFYRHHRDRLPNKFDYPATYAAVLPHTFTAILPGGGKEHLISIKDIANKCGKSMSDRWRELEGQVRERLSTTINTPGWETIWSRQHKSVFAGYWTAVQWQVPVRITNDEEFKRLYEGGALPAQDRTKLPPPSNETLARAMKRTDRLSVWMPRGVWAHYERARAVFGRVNLSYVQNERGFDYALAHHELRMRQRLRKQEAQHRFLDEEPGEKCTQCRTREALRVVGSDAENIDTRRAQVREFWREIWQKQREPERTDRLCGVCAFKRFLVEAGGENSGINPIFQIPGEKLGDADDTVRVPFPSTSAIAAQEFLAAATASDDQEVQDAISRVVAAHRSTDLKRTLFPQTLTRLRDAGRRNPSAKAFLETDPQETIFPEALQTLIDRAGAAGDSNRASQLVRLREAVENLRRVANKPKDPKQPSVPKIRPPDRHIAVVRLDGDFMGRLLLGDSNRVGVVWRDVIHPRVVERLETIDEMREAGWPSLLDAPRLMGPSLHAFVSRALADFSHRIVPWVVEEEYRGCLIYAGGDDVLAIAPARDALPMAARLQQLFSAAWILDTRPEEPPWGWRSPTGEEVSLEQARLRFLIPARLESTKPEKSVRLPAIELPLDRSRLEPAIGVEAQALPSGPLNGEVIAGLGPSQSLSASIVFGHFKTQLSLLLRESRRLLDETAKESAGRGAVAMSHRSRGGSKSVMALSWTMTGASQNKMGLKAHEVVDLVVRAFRDERLPKEQRLPGRLPYKLRSVAPLLLVETDLKWPEDLASGLLTQAIDGVSLSEELNSAVLTVWEQGYKLHVSSAQASSANSPDLLRRAAERSVDGLLLCRYLASQGTEE